MYLMFVFLVVAISAAAVASAVVTVIVVMVMIADSIRLISQCTCQQFFYSHVSRTHNAGIQLDPRFCQSHSCTAADAAANQHICIQSCQHTGQSTVTAAVSIHHLGCHDLAVLDVIDLELFGVSKVLEDVSVFIGNCDSHNIVSFRFFM